MSNIIWRRIIGIRIATKRKFAGLKQTELAENIGMNYTTLNRIELGKTFPTLITLEKLTLALGCTYDDLISREQTITLAPLKQQPNPAKEHWKVKEFRKIA